MGTSNYDSCKATEERVGKAQAAAFDATFRKEIDSLKNVGYEFQNGMIVRSLTRDEKISVGQVAYDELSDSEKKNSGSCYVNPSSCGKLLHQDFEIKYNDNGVTLKRQISNGQIGGRSSTGYISGTQTETRYVGLAKVDPVVAPKGKDLFDLWDTAEWNDVEKQASNVMNNFSTAMEKDSKALAQSTAIIRNIESTNERRFQTAKQAKEAQDSLVRDLVIAYLTGGMAGVKGAVQNKIEDQINTSLATALARASGADDDQIALLTQAISFMRGKVAERNIKSNMAANNLTNAAGALGTAVASFGNSFVQLGTAFTAFQSGNFALAGQSFANSVTGMGQGFTAMGQAATAFASSSQGAIATGLYLAGGNTIATGTAIGAYREVAGDKAANHVTQQLTGPQTRIAEIKAERESMLQSNVTQAVALATGLPAEVIGNIVTDYKGSREARRVRRAVDSNPVAGVVSRIASATLGVYKTAVVALGVPDRKIIRALADGNNIAFSGITDTRFQQANLAFASQALGMQAPGTSYASATPSLKDKNGLVKELGQRMTVDALSAGMTKEEKEVLAVAIRGAVSRRDQKKAEKKAQTAALRSTAITAVTLGAATQFNVMPEIVQGFFGTAKVFGASVGLVAQTIDGSRNGTDGMLAGFANGAIGVLTAGGNMRMDGFTNQALAALNGTTLGLGVTYDRQAGYGGMLGIGGDRSNVNIAFSQHGDTTISGSVNTSGGLQLTGSSTTNGSTTVGANYNPSNEGPRRGSNYSLNYDLDNGRLSGSGGYTDTRTGIGFTTNVDSNGLSLSTQYNGNNIATVSGNGFQYDEFNWAQNNINVAQNETGDAERAAKERETLLRRGIRADAIDAMTASDRTELAAAYTRLDENASLLATDSYTREMIDAMTPLQREAALNELHHAVTPDAIAASAMALLGSSAVAFGFMLGGKTNSNTPAGSSSAGQVASNGTKGRRKEGEDVDEDGRPTPPKQPELLPNPMPSPEPKAPEAPSSPGAEPKKIVKRYPLDSAELAKPVSIDRTQYSLTEQGQSDVKKLQERASKLNTKASDSEIADLNKKQAATRAEVQRPLNELRQEIQTLRETIEANRRGQEIGSGISGGSDSANSTSSIQVNPAAEARLNKLRKQEIALTQQVTKELVTLSKQEGVQRAALAEKARLSSLDVLAPNPYRSDVDKLKTQLDNTDKKAGDYTKLKDQYNAIKIKSDAFDSSRDTLLNPKTKPADLGLAAERIKSLNPDAEVPSPTATIVPENRPNRESLAPGYDPKGNVGGVLPGINYPGAIVSNTPLDHSSRGNGTAYHATDIALPHGTPYMPVAEGTAEVINDPKGYGKLVKINHGNGVETLYAHNSEVQVTNGQHVTSTTVIANVGNTGHVGSSYPTEAPWYGGSHIHYELHINEMKVPSQNFDWGRYNTEGQSYVDQYYEQYGPNSPGYNYEVKK